MFYIQATRKMYSEKFFKSILNAIFKAVFKAFADEANQQMWGLLGGHDGQGQWVNLARMPMSHLCTFQNALFNDHRESGPQFNTRAFLGF